MSMSPGTAPAPHIIIPCYNAGDRLGRVVAAALPLAARVLVVDDGSTDGCAAPARVPGAEVLVFPKNRGKGHALLAGIEQALADGAGVVCLMDADGQHDPAELPGMLAAFREGRADLLIGERQFGGAQVPWRSRFGNQTTALISRLLLGRALPDTQCGYRLLSPEFARAVLRHVPGGRYETEMDMLVLAVRGGFRLAYAPIRTVYEPGNKSSHFRKVRDSVRIYARLLRAVLRRGPQAGQLQ